MVQKGKIGRIINQMTMKKCHVTNAIVAFFSLCGKDVIHTRKIYCN